ncbi:hypothetical protein QAD02_007626 [Eretmocerus hayati]|uniref:Uncharacterized protein n=1 Tax=Eretmocerus hayati TaxID=131215 RepID=A0ACC2N441_9HYME|nr:hypothetical protein QAD02_007626 [Eretmocerus hayati]
MSSRSRSLADAPEDLYPPEAMPCDAMFFQNPEEEEALDLRPQRPRVYAPQVPLPAPNVKEDQRLRRNIHHEHLPALRDEEELLRDDHFLVDAGEDIQEIEAIVVPVTDRRLGTSDDEEGPEDSGSSSVRPATTGDSTFSTEVEMSETEQQRFVEYLRRTGETTNQVGGTTIKYICPAPFGENSATSGQLIPIVTVQPFSRGDRERGDVAVPAPSFGSVGLQVLNHLTSSQQLPHDDPPMVVQISDDNDSDIVIMEATAHSEMQNNVEYIGAWERFERTGRVEDARELREVLRVLALRKQTSEPGRLCQIVATEAALGFNPQEEATPMVPRVAPMESPWMPRERVLDGNENPGLADVVMIAGRRLFKGDYEFWADIMPNSEMDEQNLQERTLEHRQGINKQLGSPSGMEIDE